jgi:hypothetical protein
VLQCPRQGAMRILLENRVVYFSVDGSACEMVSPGRLFQALLSQEWQQHLCFCDGILS